MADYPEHEKLMLVKHKSQAIGEFLEWAEEVKGLTLGWWDEEDGMFRPEHGSINSLLAEFFGIDLGRVEAEKRAMLAELRARKT